MVPSIKWGAESIWAEVLAFVGGEDSVKNTVSQQEVMCSFALVIKSWLSQG